MQTTADSTSNNPPNRSTLDSAVIRFAGDSGDGMQLTGTQFSQSTAVMGNDLATFPDFPAEIRAPAGTTFGVSGFQIHFASHDILTPGDEPDVLVAMNPAALKVNIADLVQGGLLIINTGAFTPANLKKAGYTTNPLDDGSLDAYRRLELDISKMTLAAVEPFGLGTKEALRCKNLWTLGLMYWLFDRRRAPTVSWLETKFAKNPDVAKANIAAMNAGHVYGETAELPSGIGSYRIDKAKLDPGEYRNVTGNEAAAWGLVTGARLAGLPMFYGSYPITPASNILHSLSKLKHFGVTTFQAEDEIAAVCAAIGASFAGSLGVTATSGPGVALKTEGIGLAVVTELPLVIVDVQRAGPSTGMPTKTEQSDLLQAVYGRNGDAPIAVLAPATPGDCYELAIEAVRLATQFMTPVMLLTDGYLGNGAEPWLIPDADALTPFPVTFHSEAEGFHPYLRDEKTLARVWPLPGTAGLEHRIGGLEKDRDSGNISYDPDNHHTMTKLRAEKIAKIADHVPAQEVSTGPLPRGLGDLLRSYRKVLVPEMNNGMLVKMLRSEYLVDAEGLNKISGQPFKVSEISAAIRQRLTKKAS
jgi:2-oxoglutarate ferredoxin oxidoreductase subunit alpha